MKAAKRWITTGPSTCALCRNQYPASTRGVLVDLSTPVELTTIVKFICQECSTPIATAVYGQEISKAARGGR